MTLSTAEKTIFSQDDIDLMNRLKWMHSGCKQAIEVLTYVNLNFNFFVWISTIFFPAQTSNFKRLIQFSKKTIKPIIYIGSLINDYFRVNYGPTHKIDLSFPKKPDNIKYYLETEEIKGKETGSKLKIGKWLSSLILESTLSPDSTFSPDFACTVSDELWQIASRIEKYSDTNKKIEFVESWFKTISENKQPANSKCSLFELVCVNGVKINEVNLKESIGNYEAFLLGQDQAPIEPFSQLKRLHLFKLVQIKQKLVYEKTELKIQMFVSTLIIGFRCLTTTLTYFEFPISPLAKRVIVVVDVCIVALHSKKLTKLYPQIGAINLILEDFSFEPYKIISDCSNFFYFRRLQPRHYSLKSYSLSFQIQAINKIIIVLSLITSLQDKIPEPITESLAFMLNTLPFSKSIDSSKKIVELFFKTKLKKFKCKVKKAEETISEFKRRDFEERMNFDFGKLEKTIVESIKLEVPTLHEHFGIHVETDAKNVEETKQKLIQQSYNIMTSTAGKMIFSRREAMLYSR